MRDQGGATLFSSKLSVKVGAPVGENSEARRRVGGNGGGGYGGSYVGGKSMQVGGTTSASSSGGGGFRFKGVSENPSSIGHGIYRNHPPSEQLDLYKGSSADRVVKEYRGESEPLLTLKRKAAPSPPLHDEEPSAAGGGALPQWGVCKRSRRSRFEASKPAPSSSIARVPESTSKASSSITRVPESASKAVQQRAERQSNGEDIVGSRRRGQGWAARPATLDGNTKGAAPRNGSSRFSDTALANHHSHGSSAPRPDGEKERERAAAPHKLEHRHRIYGSAEPPSSTDHGFSATHNRGTSFTESAMVGDSAKPRLDLKTLEWPRILMNLSRKEKEEDFQKIKGPGSKLPQRPKKRPKAVERALQYCTPGTCLVDLVRGRYDVKKEKPVKKKSRGGLKAMDSMESDSE